MDVDGLLSDVGEDSVGTAKGDEGSFGEEGAELGEEVGWARDGGAEGEWGEPDGGPEGQGGEGGVFGGWWDLAELDGGGEDVCVLMGGRGDEGCGCEFSTEETD